jgi:hypothetical protein
MGVVLFIGRSHLGPDLYLGMELGEKEGGEHSGTVRPCALCVAVH